MNPDTKIEFARYKLPYFEKITKVAIMVHKCLPSIGYVNWDLEMNRDNQVLLIESNLQCGSLWMFENAWWKTSFEEIVILWLV